MILIAILFVPRTSSRFDPNERGGSTECSDVRGYPLQGATQCSSSRHRCDDEDSWSSVGLSNWKSSTRTVLHTNIYNYRIITVINEKIYACACCVYVGLSRYPYNRRSGSVGDTLRASIRSLPFLYVTHSLLSFLHPFHSTVYHLVLIKLHSILGISDLRFSRHLYPEFNLVGANHFDSWNCLVHILVYEQPIIIKGHRSFRPFHSR